MELTSFKTDFLLDGGFSYLDRRSVLIDLFTEVQGRSSLLFYGDEELSPKNPSMTIDLDSPDLQREFIEPLSYTEIEETAAELKSDPIAMWESSERIAIMRPNEALIPAVNRFLNWCAMTEEQKHKSDEEANSRFSKTNTEIMAEIYHTAKHEKDELIIVDIIQLDKSYKCVAYVKLNMYKQILTINYLHNGTGSILSETDTLTISNVINYNSPTPIKTTVGRFLLNTLLNYKAFGDHFPYDDSVWNLQAYNKKIAEGLLDKKLSVTQFKVYVNNLYFIGHFTELCVPTVSLNALTTHADMKKKKEELMTKYAGRLSDPLVIATIEDELIKLDKTHLKDDVSMRFYTPLGAKPFDIARKKMFITVGGIEEFSKETGKYVFIKNALSEGWDKKNMPAICNEIRKGSYSRGHETQLGGAQTKFINRVFQDVVIKIPDCKTVQGIKVDFDRYGVSPFIGRYVSKGNEWIQITKDNIGQFEGKTLTMRSPLYCKCKDGLCYMCMGDTFKTLSVTQLAMLAVDISSTFTTMSLKNMHGTKLALYDITDIDRFVIKNKEI